MALGLRRRNLFGGNPVHTYVSPGAYDVALTAGSGTAADGYITVHPRP